MKSLPRGRHGLARDYIVEHQRERILAAIAESLDDNGYDCTTVAAIASTAGVSKSDFYNHFESKDECFLVAYDAALEQVRADVRNARAGESRWPEGICAGLIALLACLEAAPAQANLLLVEGLRAGPHIYGRYQVAVESFVPCMRDGSPMIGAAVSLPLATDEAIVGGIASLLGRRVLAGEAALLTRFFPELAEFALTPYLGIAEARRIISAR